VRKGSEKKAVRTATRSNAYDKESIIAWEKQAKTPTKKASKHSDKKK